MIIYAYHNKKPVNRAKRKMRNSVDYLMLLNTHPPTAAALVVVSDHCTCCYHCSIKKKNSLRTPKNSEFFQNYFGESTGES